MLIGLSLHEGDQDAVRRQSAACAALVGLDGIEAVNLQFTSGASLSDSRLPTLRALNTDSTQMAGSSGRRKPIAREMFDVLSSEAAARSHRYFAYINADIVVTRALVHEIGCGGRESYAVSRCDVGPGTPDRMVTSGQDMFVMSVSWWQRNRLRFRPYILGEACWDNVYTAVMMCHSQGVLLNRHPLILHERHPTAWRDATPAARYNGLLAALDARYFDRWAQYWHRLEQLRAAASPSSVEDQLARDMFVWKRSAPEALRHVVRSARARWRYHRLRAEWMTQPSAG
jgi:hypothetical protein